ncbi:MAG TPA: hypothetical protein VN843_28695 [Anaerolineales bacterium]|nr:hypothetical protein [Anaerolineales bacterium]
MQQQHLKPELIVILTHPDETVPDDSVEENVLVTCNWLEQQ